MRDTYSLYEAKARLSALVRMVREGRRIVITLHGRPAIEMRAIESDAGDLAGRLASLEERGVLVRRKDPKALKLVARRAGALKRFLDDRD